MFIFYSFYIYSFYNFLFFHRDSSIFDIDDVSGRCILERNFEKRKFSKTSKRKRKFFTILRFDVDRNILFFISFFYKFSTKEKK